ncbi:hypothetical protein [Duganella sp.]|uniref:hypothetical protein n=1 Tax=Duganella sp. TaxID=1904440 RepID=UPI0031DD6968
MKREFTPKGPPFSPEEIEAVVAAAPTYVYAPDDSYDPNNEEEVTAFWSKAKRVMPGEHRFQQGVRKATNE